MIARIDAQNRSRGDTDGVIRSMEESFTRDRCRIEKA
jgi:hypothetical protein